MAKKRTRARTAARARKTHRSMCCSEPLLSPARALAREGIVRLGAAVTLGVPRGQVPQEASERIAEYCTLMVFGRHWSAEPAGAPWQKMKPR